MPNHITGPYQVIIEGWGFSSWRGFTTASEAYAEAHRIREIAESGEQVAFHNAIGSGGNYLVRGIRIFRRNPLTGKDLAHARSWRLADPAPDALTPHPAHWHFGPLPDGWFE
jgi:hypothetical protein